MRSFALSSVTVTIANASVHIANYVVFAGIAALFGATRETDAFFLAFALPAFFVGAFVGAVSSVFIPIFSQCRITRPQILGQLIGSALLYTFAGTLLIALVTGILAFGLSHRVLSNDMTFEFRQLVIQQTLLMLPVIVIQTLTGILSAFYNASDRFLIPFVTDAVSTIAVLLIIVISKSTLGIFSVPLGFVCGAAIHLLLLSMFWSRLNVRIIWAWRMTSDLRQSLTLSLPLIMGTAALQLGTIISRFLAARLPAGSVTILDYANRISYGVMELLTSGVLLVILARWSQISSKSDAAFLSGQVQKLTLMMSFIVVPIIGIGLILRHSVVAIAFQRGNFDPASTAATAGVLFFFLLGIPIDAIGRIYIRLFLVWQNTWIIGGLAAIRVVITVISAFVLMRFIGLRGIALADTLAILLITLTLILLANRRLGNTFAGSGVSLLKIGVSTVCAAVGATLVGNIWMERELTTFLIGGIAGSVIYLVISWIARDEQLKILITLLMPRQQGEFLNESNG